MAHRNKTLDALRENVQLIAMVIRSGQFKQPRTPSPSRKEDGEHRRSVNDRLGLQMKAGYEERLTRSVFERLRHHIPPLVTSSRSVYRHLSETASHQMAIDRQYEQHRNDDRGEKRYKDHRSYRSKKDRLSARNTKDRPTKVEAERVIMKRAETAKTAWNTL